MTDSKIILQHPPGSQLRHEETGPIVYVPASAEVALDDALARLWELADGRSLTELAEAVNVAASVLRPQVLALRLAGLLLPAIPKRPFSPAAIPTPAPLVSVVIVSRNGRHHLEECLPSLQAQTYPNQEIVVIDDASDDGTETFLREQYPDLTYSQQKNGPNFAAGCNQGIAHSSGDLIFLLNNDTVLDPYCVQEMVTACAGHEKVGGVAAMLRFYHNRPFVNGLGTATRRLGFGHDLGIGSLDVGQFAPMAQVPMLCFGAAMIPRSVLEQVGPIEEAYQFYLEDADWSYRARALGFDLAAAPRALVYHKFSASTGTLPSTFKTRLATRNRLWFTVKNLPMLAALAQLWLYGLDDIARWLVHWGRREGVLAGAISRAWLEYWQGLPRMLKTRRGRQRTAVNLNKLAHPFPLPQMVGALPRLSEELIEMQYRPFLERLIPGKQKQRLLIISPDSVDVNMGGVGIRYWELARQLTAVAAVTLAIPNQTSLESDTFTIQRYEASHSKTLAALAETTDIILLSGFTLYHHPVLRQTNAYLVIDLYDPMVLENLERFADRETAERNNLHQLGIHTFNDLFNLGDFFICASEKQRDYWLGALTAANRVNPAVYAADPTLRRLIDTVPFGLSSTPPQLTKKVLKGVWPGISPDDKVILWGGGLWDWLDPLTVIDAMPAVLEQVPQARLFFLGTKHPNPDVPTSRMAVRAIERAKTLGLKDKAVFFNDWTPYEERVNFLLEADVGVSLHGDHIETRFAVRTRLMDYLWASLPMVVSGGDVLSDLVKQHDLGCVIESEGETAVAQSLITMLQTPVNPANFRPVIESFHWSRVAEPLKNYMLAPWHNEGREKGRRDTAVSLATRSTPWRELPKKAVDSLKNRGFSGLWQDVRAYLIWIRQQ